MRKQLTCRSFIPQCISANQIAVLIPDAGHHEDLMFTNKRDPPALKAARRRILAHLRKWVLEARLGSSEPFVNRNVARKMWRWERDEN
jgi:hypothetical protein